MVTDVFNEHASLSSGSYLSRAGCIRFMAYASIPPSMVYTEPVTDEVR